LCRKGLGGEKELKKFYTADLKKKGNGRKGDL
jgi:hypothetical protein